MEPDSTGTYERFNPPSDNPPTAPDEQPPNQLQSPPNFGNRPGNHPFGSTQFGSTPFNQPNSGRPNRRASMADFKLTKEEQSVLNGCKSITLYGMTLPLCATYVVYSKYNALRMLKPMSNWSLAFNTAFIYTAARFVSMAVCLQELRSKCPDFNNRVKQFRNQVQREYGAQKGARPPYPPAYPPAGQQNPAPNDQDYQNWQRQRLNNPKNPYLATNQPKEDEFVQDNDDYGGGKSGSQ